MKVLKDNTVIVHLFTDPPTLDKMQFSDIEPFDNDPGIDNLIRQLCKLCILVFSHHALSRAIC